MRINDINWSDLKIFFAIAREKSLARAALSLGVTHSTVFRRINSLEEEINAKLFSRHSDGYQLTEIGKEVLSHVKQVVGNIDKLQRALDSRNNEMQGAIQVTAPHNLAYHFLPKFVSLFRASYPDITVNLMVSNENYNLSRLEADLAIRATAVPPPELVGRKLFTLRWGAYASEKYIVQFGKPVSVEELHQHFLISATKVLDRLEAFQWLEDNLSQANVVARCNDLMSMSAFAEAGMGIALLPDDQVKPGLIRLFELSAEFTSDIWLLIHPDMKQCRRLMVFRDFLIEVFRNDPLFQQYAVLD